MTNAHALPIPNRYWWQRAPTVGLVIGWAVILSTSALALAVA